MSTRQLFEQHNLRCTRQRQALFEALRACKSHPTAEELYHLVNSGPDRLSLATVYNTLDALCNAGLCRRFPTPQGVCRYDADTSHHLHTRDRLTGQIRDVPEGLGERLLSSISPETLAQIEESMGVSITAINIQFLVEKAEEPVASGSSMSE